jgi:sugar/nucleoside kinase (ribokinase family)
MGNSFDVIVVGDYCLDLIFTGLPKMPELGVEVVGSGFDMLPGATWNTVVSMHRLGIKTGWAGDFGSDDFSQLVLKFARDEGLDESLFEHHKQAMRRITVALSYPEERAFVAFYDPEAKVPAALKALTRSSARAVYVPGVYYGPAFDAGAVIMRAKRMKLIVDGNSTEDTTLKNPGVRKTIKTTDMYLPNAAEARRMTGEDDLRVAIAKLAELCPLVVVKDGPRGAYAMENGQLVHVPGLKVDVVDTTGAGDCFNSGFIRAWLDGQPLVECLKWGNIVGGLSSTARGGTGRVVNADLVRSFLPMLAESSVQERR